MSAYVGGQIVGQLLIVLAVLIIGRTLAAWWYR